MFIWLEISKIVNEGEYILGVNVMAKFLIGNKLSKKIEKVCSGENVCCAVAFWGSGAANHLFGKKNGENLTAKIICDLSMGGTNPKELEYMGVSESNNIKQLEGLHAKVYISDFGVIITSANASGNGIGFDASKTTHIEAGSFSKKDSQNWREAKKWFKQIWEKADKISAEDLEEAQELWAKRPQFRNTPKGNWSVIEALRQCPEIFGNVHFALSNEDNDEDVVEEAKKSFKKAHNQQPEGYEYFQGWELLEDGWPEVFISIDMDPDDVLTVAYYVRGPVYNDVQFSRHAKIWKSKFIKEGYIDLSLKKTNLSRKGELKKKVLEDILNDLDDKEKSRILSASDLSKLLEKHKA